MKDLIESEKSSEEIVKNLTEGKEDQKIKEFDQALQRELSMSLNKEAGERFDGGDIYWIGDTDFYIYWLEDHDMKSKDAKGNYGLYQDRGSFEIGHGEGDIQQIIDKLKKEL